MTFNLKQITLSGPMLFRESSLATFHELANMFGLNYWDIGATTASPSSQNIPNELNDAPFKSGQVGAGTLTYNQPFSNFIYNGIRFEEASIQVTSTSSALAAAGLLADDITFGCLFKTPAVANTTSGVLMAMSASGETTASNYIFQAAINTSNVLNFFWEYGSGSNQTVTTSTPLSLDTEYFLTFTRNSTTKIFKVYVNGVQYDPNLAYTNNPAGGGAGILSVGAQNNNTNYLEDGIIGIPFTGAGVLSADGVALLYQSLLG